MIASLLLHVHSDGSLSNSPKLSLPLLSISSLYFAIIITHVLMIVQCQVKVNVDIIVVVIVNIIIISQKKCSAVVTII